MRLELRERLLRLLLEEDLPRDEEERVDRLLELDALEELLLRAEEEPVAEAVPGLRLILRSLPSARVSDAFRPGRRGGWWK